ncbi:hypothetical protein GCM10008940_18360 [Microbulbifer agarilyticus]
MDVGNTRSGNGMFNSVTAGSGVFALGVSSDGTAYVPEKIEKEKFRPPLNSVWRTHNDW